jgi:hypothetical protein
MVPSEQSADLRAYYNKHAKTDRLDSKLLARLPLLHPEGLHREDALGPGDALKRMVKIRSGLVHRRTVSMARLDALLEIMGPAWVAALGSDVPDRAAVPGPLRPSGEGHQARQGPPGRVLPPLQPQRMAPRTSPRGHRRRRGDPAPVGQTAWTSTRSPKTSPWKPASP